MKGFDEPAGFSPGPGTRRIGRFGWAAIAVVLQAGAVAVLASFLPIWEGHGNSGDRSVLETVRGSAWTYTFEERTNYMATSYEISWLDGVLEEADPFGRQPELLFAFRSAMTAFGLAILLLANGILLAFFRALASASVCWFVTAGLWAGATGTSMWAGVATTSGLDDSADPQFGLFLDLVGAAGIATAACLALVARRKLKVGVIVPSSAETKPPDEVPRRA